MRDGWTDPQTNRWTKALIELLFAAKNCLYKKLLHITFNWSSAKQLLVVFKNSFKALIKIEVWFIYFLQISFRDTFCR